MWRFHVRADMRPGTVLSMVEARDGVRWRSVAYQMHCPKSSFPTWNPTELVLANYMDSGEYGFGNLFSPLRKGSTVHPMRASSP